jgi:cyanophycin synthetase
MSVPIPVGFAVRQISDALDRAQEIGYPVVLKVPTSSNGYGVAPHIESPAVLKDVFRLMSRLFPRVELLLEQFLRGDYFRLLVVDGKLLRASAGTARVVTGDSVRSIRQLLSGSETEKILRPGPLLNRLRLILSCQRKTLKSVPKEGEMVTGSPPTSQWRDVTPLVHPTTRDLMERIGSRLRPSVLGIDLLARNVSCPLEHGDGIIEVNSGAVTWFHDTRTASRACSQASPRATTNRALLRRRDSTSGVPAPMKILLCIVSLDNLRPAILASSFVTLSMNFRKPSERRARTATG